MNCEFHNVQDLTMRELDAWIRVCGQWMQDSPNQANIAGCSQIVRQCAAEKLRRVRAKNATT